MVFVPGKPEIIEIVEHLKNNTRRGFTASLYPYGFHSDTPAQDRDFLFKGGKDPNVSQQTQRELPSRTVIVATNAAKAAVTFNQCWLCIDTCMVNQMMYDASLRVNVQQTHSKGEEELVEILQECVCGW